MKQHLKRYISIKNHIEFLKRQPSHMQHVYAVIFAGSITFVLACSILYIEYGFWNERYIREDLVVSESEQSNSKNEPESPGEMFSRFYSEAFERFNSIEIYNGDSFKGKEVYKSESN